VLQPQTRANDELPPADPLILDLIAQDTMRTINIDGVPREIRFYGDTAVVMLAWDDPREIGFQGGTRLVSFDDQESVLCSFGDTYRECTIDGSTHRLVTNILIVAFIKVSVVFHVTCLQC
jgi:pre-mRNA cleavage complex 2 protein Pcf11